MPVKLTVGIGCLLSVAALLGVVQFSGRPLSTSLAASTSPAPPTGPAVALPGDAMAARYALSDIRGSSLFQPKPAIRGTIKETEISGIAVSHQRNHLFWGIEDSGNASLLYLYAARNAQRLATYKLGNIIKDDWEELQSLSDDAGKHYLIIGDTGSNRAVRKNLQLLVIEEPAIKRSRETIMLNTRIATFNFHYPGAPKNCEAFIVDPVTHGVYVFSKELSETRVYYSDKFSLSHDRTDTLELIGTLPLTMIVAADISDDGNEILMKSYHKIYYWKKEPGASLRETLFQTPQTLPYKPVEPEGESICWYNKNYLTLSEKNNAVLYEYQRR